MELQYSAHCKERQTERGITDKEVEDAVAGGTIEESWQNRKRHRGGGVTVVTQPNKGGKVATAITAFRSDETHHPMSATTYRRICEYGDSDTSDSDEDNASDEEAKGAKADLKHYGRAWNSRPSAKYWSCCGTKVQGAGEEDGCMCCKDVTKLEFAARKASYSERSQVLKSNAEQRAASPILQLADENDFHRPWDNSNGDDASPNCYCGYADGVGYDWCECVDANRGMRNPADSRSESESDPLE
jgi:hypothetical protein